MNFLTTISDIKKILKIPIYGCIPWDVLTSCPGPPPKAPGVYIITTRSEKDQCDNSYVSPSPSLRPRFNHVTIRSWISAVPKMKLHGMFPTSLGIAEYLAQFWLPDECIVYVGKASLGSKRQGLYGRIGAFFRHKLGASSPHKGGHWLPSLQDICCLRVWWSPTEQDTGAIQRECDVLKVFAGRTLAEISLPFANRDGRCIGLGRIKGNALAPQTCRQKSSPLPIR